MTGNYDSEAYYFFLINRKTGKKFLTYCHNINIFDSEKLLLAFCSVCNGCFDTFTNKYKILKYGLTKDDSSSLSNIEENSITKDYEAKLIFDKKFSDTSMKKIEHLKEVLKNNPKRQEELKKRTYGYNQGVINCIHKINNNK